jgi:hypothetical protein
MKPSPQKPRIIIAQVEGSGTGATTSENDPVASGEAIWSKTNVIIGVQTNGITRWGRRYDIGDKKVIRILARKMRPLPMPSSVDRSANCRPPSLRDRSSKKWWTS